MKLVFLALTLAVLSPPIPGSGLPAQAPVRASKACNVDLRGVPRSQVIGDLECVAPYTFKTCARRRYDASLNLAAVENGTARPAVALNTIRGYAEINQPQFANDGFYGNGACWIPRTYRSWVKVDLGKAAYIDRVVFGRDRAAGLKDRDPGQFMVEVAESDAVYANGDSSDDDTEYTVVFDSRAVGFSGFLDQLQTMQATFPPIRARFVKLALRKDVTPHIEQGAIDEIEVREAPAARADLSWSPPAGGVLDPPQDLRATVVGALAGPASDGADAAPGVAGYRVYGSDSADVPLDAEHLLATTPPSQTEATVPVGPAGTHFVVTAIYDGAEGNPSSEVVVGTPGACVARVKVTNRTIVAAGSGFTDAVQVFVDGIPFAQPATVTEDSKVVQKGPLINGQTLRTYKPVGSVLEIAFVNSNGSITRRYVPIE